MIDNSKDFKVNDFSPHLFWDVDVDEIELEKNIYFIVKKHSYMGFIKIGKLFLSYMVKILFMPMQKQ